MARVHSSLRIFLDAEARTVSFPCITNVASSTFVFSEKLSDFLLEITIGHGGKILNENGNQRWVFSFAENEFQTFLNWLSWHTQFERVESLPDIFVVPIETK